MSRYTIFAVIAALCLTVATGATLSASLTESAFAAKPGVVIDASTATSVDYTAWSPADTVQYGPGADNGTVYAYGYTVTTAVATIISRAINATLISNGTALTAPADSKIGTDGSASLGKTMIVTTTTVPILGIGLGSIGVAFVAADTASPTCNQVWLAVVNGGSSSTVVVKQVTSNACVTCGTAVDGVSYDYLVTGVYYDNSAYFVSYVAIKSTFAQANPCLATAASIQNIAYLQGVAANSTGSLIWTTTVPTIVTGTAAASPSPVASGYKLRCGLSNYTNSTTHYCTYKSGTTSTATTTYVPITVSSGAVGGGATIATDATAGTDPVVTNVYTVAGFVHSQYQQGILLNNLTTSTPGTGTATYTNTLGFYNLTSGATAVAGGVQISGWTNSLAAGAYTGEGIGYGTGYGFVSRYQSATTPVYTYEIGAYFANGTANVTKAAIATSGRGDSTWFIDANGALWFGSYSWDDTNSLVISGTLGKNVGQLYTSAQALASFFALLSVMIAAVFAF